MKINPSFVQAVRDATTSDDLKPIQEAVKLEHATIPPYLCGYLPKLDTNELLATSFDPSRSRRCCT